VSLARKAYMHEYNKKPELKEKKRIAERIRRVKNRISLIKLLGDKCAQCGFADYRALQIDHIKGGGTKHRLLFPNNEQFVKYYLRHPEEATTIFQILCANCNFIKRYSNNEVTHYDMYGQVIAT